MTKRSFDHERFIRRAELGADLDGKVLVDKTNMVKTSTGVAMRLMAERAIKGLGELNNGQSSRPLHHRLRMYREYSEDLIRCYVLQSELWQASSREIGQLMGEGPSAARKRWTDVEDELLVEQACEGDSSLITLALNFNRSPQAVSSRLTYLVGVSRVSREVVGRLTGYLDGEQVTGHFKGKLEIDR